MSAKNEEVRDAFDLQRDEQVAHIMQEHCTEFEDKKPLLEALLKLAYTLGSADVLQQRYDLIQLNEIWKLTAPQRVRA